MTSINFLAVGISAVAAFVIGGLWYSPLLFGTAATTLRGLDPANAPTAMPVSEIAAEFARWLIIAFVMARLFSWLGAAGLWAGVQAGLWAWVAIYTALAGSVLHEGYPWRLSAIHAGDGLLKLLVISAILSIWQTRQRLLFVETAKLDE